MLLNLVRLRYLDVPVFLRVSSVVTQYTYEGEAGLEGRRGFQTASDLLTAVVSRYAPKSRARLKKPWAFPS